MPEQKEPEIKWGDYILIVDDEPAVLGMVSADLKDWANAHELSIIAAKSGAQALELLNKYAPNVWIMITDIRMPEMDGIELLHTTASLHPLLVSLTLTVEDNLLEVSKTVRAGVFGFIPKPWETEQLLINLDRAYSLAKARRDSRSYLRSLETELQWAGELQRKLLDVELPRRDELEVDILYRPLPWLSCGGDYYDVIPYRDDSVIVLIGDVAGHGVKAAFVTAMLKSLIYRGFVRKSLETGFSPSHFLEWLNLQFLQEFVNIPDVILTFSATIVNFREKTLSTARAGHEPIFLNRDSSLSALIDRGPVIGVSEEVIYHNTETELLSGDTLTFITDGLIEYPREGRRLDNEKIFDILSGYPEPVAAGDELIDEFMKELKMEEQQDDITLIRMKLL